jgi:hypothetical protein
LADSPEALQLEDWLGDSEVLMRFDREIRTPLSAVLRELHERVEDERQRNLRNKRRLSAPCLQKRRLLLAVFKSEEKLKNPTG